MAEEKKYKDGECVQIVGVVGPVCVLCAAKHEFLGAYLDHMQGWKGGIVIRRNNNSNSLGFSFFKWNRVSENTMWPDNAPHVENLRQLMGENDLAHMIKGRRVVKIKEFPASALQPCSQGIMAKVTEKDYLLFQMTPEIAKRFILKTFRYFRQSNQEEEQKTAQARVNEVAKTAQARVNEVAKTAQASVARLDVDEREIRCFRSRAKKLVDGMVAARQQGDGDVA